MITAINRRIMALIFVVLLYVMLFINRNIFIAVTSVLTVYICLKSLFCLYLYNFSSDETLEKYEKNIYLPKSREEILISRFKNIMLGTIIALFFGSLAFTSNINFVKFPSVFLCILWAFDMIKALLSYYDNRKDTDWTVVDSILETLMWIQNISSIFVIFLFFNTI